MFLAVTFSLTLIFPEMFKQVRTIKEASLVKHNIMLKLSTKNTWNMIQPGFITSSLIATGVFGFDYNLEEFKIIYYILENFRFPSRRLISSNSNLIFVESVPSKLPGTSHFLFPQVNTAVNGILIIPVWITIET